MLSRRRHIGKKLVERKALAQARDVARIVGYRHDNLMICIDRIYFELLYSRMP